ncbi:MAG: glycerol-3-phosphate acyltransferase [Bacillota bacterium]
MGSFYILALMGYTVGQMPFEQVISRLFPPSHPHAETSSFLLSEALKGLLSITIARLWIGTPFALVVAGLFTLIGQMWPFIPRSPHSWRGVIIVAITLSSLSARVFTLATVVGIFMLLATRSLSATPVLTSLTIPVLVLLGQKPDIYFVFSTLAAGIISYRFIELYDNDTCLVSRRYRILKSAVRKAFVFFSIVSILLLFYLNRYVYRGFGMHVDLFRRGSSSFPVVALTFDDGPHPYYTNQILDILKENGIRATFFLVGKHVEMYPDVVRRISEEGHEIGNHTYSHQRMLGMSARQVMHEITRTENAIREVTGCETRLFRPPQGLYTSTVLGVLQEMKYTMVLWSVSSQDWAEPSWRQIVRTVLKRTGPGDIILFHDSGDLLGAQGGDRSNTVRALPVLIQWLKQEGYTFVTCTEMMVLSGLSGER